MMTFLIAQAFFIMGFCLGRILPFRRPPQDNVENFFTEKKDSTHSSKKRLVKIDEAKFVTDVSIEALKQSNLELGKKTSVDDDIESSVNRLAQLKKLK